MNYSLDIVESKHSQRYTLDFQLDSLWSRTVKQKLLIPKIENISLPGYVSTKTSKYAKVSDIDTYSKFFEQMFY